MQDDISRGRKRKKRILVTGGSGFIGWVVVRDLSKLYEIRVLGRKKVKIAGIESFLGNLLDAGDVTKAMDNVDCIVHLAAMMQGRENDIHAFNVNSTKTLVDASLKKNIRKFVFLSSENALWQEQSAYGKSKKACEEIVKQLPNFLILQSTAVYGKEGKAVLGNVINYVKCHRVILVPGNGRSLMQPIYVEDVSRYIINGIANNVRGTYIIAGKSKISFNDFVDAVARKLCVKRIKIHIPLWILNPVVFILQRIFINPPIKMSQLKNLNTDRIYKLDKTIKALKHSPIDIEQGVRKTLS